MNSRPHTTAIVAMTADGKISDFQRSPARFGSASDKIHLEQQISVVDGVIFGADTLRAYGTTLTVSNPVLLQERTRRSQFPQPVQIVVSASGNLDQKWRFFEQPVPRWLLTVPSGADQWGDQAGFERVFIFPQSQVNSLKIDWAATFAQLKALSLNKLAVLGGGELIASLLAEDLIDELWLTVCPLILGGNAPTPVGGQGFIQSQGKKLTLLEVKQVGQEVFLHYERSSQQL
ncbi:MAG: RibD family protein [Cyanobacteria bacterium J06621_8]